MSMKGQGITRALQLKVLYYRHLYRGTEGGGGVDRIKPIPRELMHRKIPVSFECDTKRSFHSIEAHENQPLLGGS